MSRSDSSLRDEGKVAVQLSRREFLKLSGAGLGASVTGGAFLPQAMAQESESAETALGILYDPSHFIWQGIDYIRFLYDFKDRIFCVHAQDMDLDEEKMYQHGILNAGIEVQQRRVPGMGRVDWQAVIRALYNIGYDWVMNIEHEDPNWEGSVEKVQGGFLLAKKHLEGFTV